MQKSHEAAALVDDDTAPHSATPSARTIWPCRAARRGARRSAPRHLSATQRTRHTHTHERIDDDVIIGLSGVDGRESACIYKPSLRSCARGPSLAVLPLETDPEAKRFCIAGQAQNGTPARAARPRSIRRARAARPRWAAARIMAFEHAELGQRGSVSRPSSG